MPIPLIGGAKLAGWAASKWLGPLLIVVAIAGAYGYHKFTLWQANERTEDAEQARDLARSERDTARTELATAKGNITTLRSTVRRQNDAITALHEVGRGYEQAAKLRAVERLRTGEKERMVIRLDPNFGPAAMNLWFQLTFGQAK